MGAQKPSAMAIPQNPSIAPEQHQWKSEETRDITKKFDAIDLTVNEATGTFDVDQNIFNQAIKGFNPDEMKTDGAMIILGKRRTGKSHLCMDLMSHIGDRYSTAVVLTGTKFNGYWQDIVPEEYIHSGFQESVLTTCMKSQKQVVRKCRSENPDLHKRRECECNMVVILDDVASEEHLQRSLVLGALYTKGRHYYITPIVMSQYAYAISPAIRSNIDYAFIMHQTQRRSKDAIGDEWMSQVRRREAADIMSKHTPGYQVLVIDNSEATDDLGEVLSIYTAADEDSLIKAPLGHEEYYQAVQKRPEELQTEQMKEHDEMRGRQSQPMMQFPQCLKALEGDADLLLDSKYI